MTFIHEIKNIVKSVGLGDLSFFTIPNDKIEFNPMKYDNVSFIVNGQMHGTVKIVHGRYELDHAMIVSKIFLTDESMVGKVSITPVFSENGLTVTIEGPRQFTRARYDTEIAFPKRVTDLSSLKLEVVDATVEIGEMNNLFIDKVDIINTNGSIDAKLLKSSTTHLKAANGPIAGSYQPTTEFIAVTSNGNIESSVSPAMQPLVTELSTTNGHIKGFYRLAKKFSAKTTNGSVSIQGHIKNEENIDVNIVSTNGSVGLILPRIYKGRFQLETMWGPTSVNELLDVKFETDTRSTKIGVKGDDLRKGNIRLSTVNGGAKLEFKI
ncbi:3286_t:CDS:2 [Paraglomus brasilianum]|uniref:3286_t:CDS:1 n=1 Tax=Paraglomus brasilianum TaxID=144538 RepID=A0A9N9DTR6_9GLOM|nr:3286_t:CDS:2 [Paraglomus brasilianum]